MKLPKSKVGIILVGVYLLVIAAAFVGHWFCRNDFLGSLKGEIWGQNTFLPCVGWIGMEIFTMFPSAVIPIIFKYLDSANPFPWLAIISVVVHSALLFFIGFAIEKLYRKLKHS